MTINMKCNQNHLTPIHFEERTEVISEHFEYAYNAFNSLKYDTLLFPQGMQEPTHSKIYVLIENNVWNTFHVLETQIDDRNMPYYSISDTIREFSTKAIALKFMQKSSEVSSKESIPNE